MKPINFPQKNVTYAENQPEYQPLPAYRNEQETISCWKFSFRERWSIFCGKPLWLRQMNFGHALQPQLPTIEYPFIRHDRTLAYNQSMKCYGWTKKVKRFDCIVIDGEKLIVSVIRKTSFTSEGGSKSTIINFDCVTQKKRLLKSEKVLYFLRVFKNRFYPI